MIRIQTLPVGDIRFRSLVAGLLGDDDYADALLVESPGDLERLASSLRAEYPSAWFRRQHPLASVEQNEVWYLFREGARRLVAR